MYHICVCIIIYYILSFSHGSAGKEYACYVGDLGSIPGLGRFPEGGHVNPLQYSFLGNPRDRGAWQATLHEVTKSQSQLNNSAQHRWAVSAQVQPGEGSLCRVSHWRTGALLLEGGGALSPQNCVAPGDRAAD